MLMARNATTIGLIIPFLLLLFPGQAQAVVDRQQCKFQGLQGGKWTQTEENDTARCVTRRWSVPGGLAKLRAVGSCESGWNRFATNGRYVGLFQHDKDAWPARVRSYTPPHWELQPGWQNSRTQIVVTVRMVRAQGWGAWTCA